MARLQSVEKILYVPTRDETVKLIASHFKTTGERTRIVDPCCGKGEALASFANSLEHKPETWGIEISYSRSKFAANLLDTVIPASFYDVRPPGKWENHSVSLVFNNPPYDWSHFEEIAGAVKKHVRHEVLFLEWTRDKIVPGGHHVYIIPRAILGDPGYLTAGKEERVARHLLGWYQDVSVWCDPQNPEYNTFNQIIVLACDKRASYQAPKKEDIDRIMAYQTELIPDIRQLDKVWELPPAPVSARFQYVPMNEPDLLRLGRECSPIGTPEYDHATYVRPLGAPFNPLTPLNLGHVTMLVSGKEAGVVTLQNDKGNPFLMKGATIKEVDVEARDNTNPDGEYTSTSVTTREKFRSVISVVSKKELLTISNVKEVGEFMTKYGSKIADVILKKNKPLYNWDPTEDEWKLAGECGLGLPALPGRKTKGPFAAQMHFGIAAYRGIKKNGATIMNAEMGFGKTLTAQIVMNLLDEWPIIVACPGHIVAKWRRDIERSAPPEKPVVARIITRPLLSELPNWFTVRDTIESLGGRIVEVSRSQVDPIVANDPGTRRTVVIAYDDVTAQAKILKYVSGLKLRESKGRNEKATRTMRVVGPEISYDKRGMVVEYVDHSEYTMLDFEHEYKTGKLGKRAVAIVGYDPAKYDAGYKPGFAVRKQARRIFDEKKMKVHIVKVETCPNCGKIVEPDPKVHTCEHCGLPIREFSRFRRIGLARLIQKKYKGFFKMYIADEVHKTKSGDTDIGVMDQRMLASVKYSLALTGTLFGGNAGSLFYLLYRRSLDIRKRYGFSDKHRWVDHYGVWKKAWSQNTPHVAGRGSFTNIKRMGYREDELPGVSPGVIQFLLPITVFGNITDLGYELPPVREEIESLVMPAEMREQYEVIQTSILKDAVSMAMQKRDPGALSMWFATARYRPASAFRTERAFYESKRSGDVIDYPLPAVVSKGEWLPKEKRLAEIVYQNMQAGRKTLCFVEQSGTRDIRDRLKSAVETLAPGASFRLAEVGVLSANSMSPSRREAWINKKAPLMDILLVNPKLVETGLDLIMFPDLIFYETTTSLYVLWQAMRRVWRLGQSKDVNVTFLSYEGTIEQEILARMGKKMRAAQLLYGKDAGGILVEENGEEDDDIQRKMIEDALKGKTFKEAGEVINKGVGIFSTGKEKIIRTNIVEEPEGSVVATNPILTVTDLPSGETLQLTLFPGLAPIKKIEPINRKKKGKGTIQQAMWIQGD